MVKPLNKLRAAALRDGFMPPADEPIWMWAEKFVKLDKTSHYPGHPWRSSVTPWVIMPLQAFQNPLVRDITTVGPSQGAKTTPALVALQWAIANAPGMMLYVTADAASAKETSQDRIIYSLRKCSAIKLSSNRHETGIWSVRLDTCTLRVTSAGSEMGLETTPYRFVFADECRKWGPGILQQIEKRTRTYPNCKRFKFSTPDKSGSEFHLDFLAGSQHEWFFLCMGCGKEIHLSPPKTFEMLVRWNTNETTKPGGKWDVDQVAKTLGLECTSCHYRHHDLVEVRTHIATRGYWKQLNPIATREHFSCRYNAFLPTWIKWIDIWKEFQGANELRKIGNIEPLKVFVTETLVEFWDEQEHVMDIVGERPVATYSFADVGTVWGDLRFLTVDVQMHDLWGVVRGWMRDTAESKLLWAGRIETFDQVEVLREKYGIPAPHRKANGKWTWPKVFIDCKYERREVYKRCCEHKWMAVEGMDSESFPWVHAGKTTQRIYSRAIPQDPGLGRVEQGARTCPLVKFSDPGSQEILDRLKDGKGALWEVPSDVPEFYWKQLHAEVRAEIVNKQTGRMEWKYKQIRRDNHLRDCEKIQVVAASMAGILRKEEVAEEAAA